MLTGRAHQGGDARLVSVDLARVVAAIIVFATHIAVQFLRDDQGVRGPYDAERVLIDQPLGLPQYGVGLIAIYLFFLVSGFVVTPIAMRLGAAKFAVNRFFRVYPLLAFAVVVGSALLLLGLKPLTWRDPGVSAMSVLGNLTLVTFSIKPYEAIVGVTWTLAIEVMFYALLICVFGALRRRIWVGILIELDVVVAAALAGKWLPGGFAGLCGQLTYLTIPIVGQILWALWSRNVRATVGVGLLVATGAVAVLAHGLELDPQYPMEVTPLAYALPVLVVGLVMEPRLRRRRWIVAASERTYSLYVMHGLIALPLMIALGDAGLRPWLTVPVGIAATLAGVELTYRYVERPSHSVGRRLSRRRSAPLIAAR